MQLLYRTEDVLHLWCHSFFQGWAVRRRTESAVDPADRRVEIIEAGIGYTRGDLRSEAAGRKRLIDDEEPAGLLYGGKDGFRIQRRDGARIDDFDRDAFLHQLFSSDKGTLQHYGHGHDRQVAAFAGDA